MFFLVVAVCELLCNEMQAASNAEDYLLKALNDKVVKQGVSASLEVGDSGYLDKVEVSNSVSFDSAVKLGVLAKLSDLNSHFLNYVPSSLADNPDWIGNRKIAVGVLRGSCFEKDCTALLKQAIKKGEFGGGAYVFVFMPANVWFRDLSGSNQVVSVREAMNIIAENLGAGWYLTARENSLICHFFSKGPRQRIKPIEEIQENLVKDKTIAEMIDLLMANDLKGKMAVVKALPSRKNLPVQYRETVRKELVKIVMDEESGPTRSFFASELWRFFEYPLNISNDVGEIKKRFPEREQEKKALDAARDIEKTVEFIKNGDAFQKVISILQVKYAVSGTHQYTKGEINSWILLIANQLLDPQIDPLVARAACRTLADLCSLEL
ncbi:MAG: hypothetical protein PHV34_04350 [Verrucomicrobiae bacterium]|nr:hypothetical protein [Verrucomicrobiae bacterium]